MVEDFGKNEFQTYSKIDLIDFIQGSTLLATGGGKAAGWQYEGVGQIAEQADTERHFNYADTEGKSMHYITNTDTGSLQPLTVSRPELS